MVVKISNSECYDGCKESTVSSNELKSRKVSVCHISTVHPHTDVRIFHRECCSLVKAGYEVHLVIPCGESCIKEGVHFHSIRRVRNRFLRMLIMPWAAMWIALKTQSSIYHYHDPELLFMGFMLKWIFCKKVVFDIHEAVVRSLTSKSYLPQFTRKPMSLCYQFLERIFITGQALVIANKNSEQDYTKKTYLVQNYPLLDEETIRFAEARTKMPEVPLFVYVGVVAKVRGAEVSIDLAAKLVEREHDFRMQIIGQYSAVYGNKLKLKIKELNLQNVVQLPGHMNWFEAMKLVSNASIGMCLLLPTPNYTTCLATKIIEYMMCGTPVLCSKYDHWKPYVEGEGTGMMVDPTNIDEVADVSEKMLSDPDELVVMGRRGVAAVRNKYNWESEFKTLLKCYDDLLK